MDNYHFRFEDLKTWKLSIQIAQRLIKLSVLLDDHKFYRFSDQLKGAVLSVSNNISEGAGSSSRLEFKRYLSYARASAFECANIIFVMAELNLINDKEKKEILTDLDTLSRMIQNLKGKL